MLRILFAMVAMVTTLVHWQAVANGPEDVITKEEVAAVQITDLVDWKSALEKVWSLTPDQIQKYVDRGYSYPQMAIVAAMARAAQKDPDDVWNLREGQQLSWPDLATNLGVDQAKIAQAVAKVRKDVQSGRYKARAALMPSDKTTKKNAKPAASSESKGVSAPKARAKPSGKAGH